MDQEHFLYYRECDQPRPPRRPLTIWPSFAAPPQAYDPQGQPPNPYVQQQPQQPPQQPQPQSQYDTSPIAEYSRQRYQEWQAAAPFTHPPQPPPHPHPHPHAHPHSHPSHSPVEPLTHYHAPAYHHPQQHQPPPASYLESVHTGDGSVLADHPPISPSHSPVTGSALPKQQHQQAQHHQEPEPLDEEPLYVNAKQYHRILKRRLARQRLEEVHRLSRQRKVLPLPLVPFPTH